MLKKMTILQLRYLSTKYDELALGLTNKDFVDNASDYFERNHAEYYMYTSVSSHQTQKWGLVMKNILCPLLLNSQICTLPTCEP